MATNKVVYAGATLIDLTNDTITEEVLLKGYTAHKADGTRITGQAFRNYPDQYSFAENLQDSGGRIINDGSSNIIQGETIYKKV